MYGLKPRSKKDESGLIQGAGTGTSDSIKKDVPAGSYIMPADSTAQLGARNLKNLGSPTPVNVSNGEYQMSPEQVYQVGMQTLERMKNATHSPVPEQQGFGFKSGATMAQAQPQGEPPRLGFNAAALAQYQDNIKMGASGKPELYFANGTPSGGVPDEDTFLGLSKKAWTGNALQQPKSQAPATSPQNKSTSQQNSGFGAFAKNVIAPTHDDGSWNPIGGLVNTATGLGQAALGTVGGLAAGAGEGARSTLATLGGADNPDRGNMVAPSFEFAGKGLDQAELGWRQMGGLAGKQQSDPANAATQPNSGTATQAAAKPDPAKTVGAAVQATAKPSASTMGVSTNTSTQTPTTDLPQQNTKQPVSMFADTSTQNTAQVAGNPYAIQQNGNSFSYANPGAAAQARTAGVPELQSSGIQTGLGIRGVKDFMANTREMGASDQQIKAALARREMNLGMQGFGGIARQPQVPERTPEQEAQLQTEIQRVSAPIAGARGLTASQRNQINDLQQGYANRENDNYKTDANNAAALQREAMGQVGQNYRAELGEQGANSRFNSNLELDAQKFNATNDLTNRQFSAEQLSNMPARMKQQAELNLLQQYDAAQTDEERKPILEKLGMLRGQTQQQSGNPYMSIKQGEVVDGNGVVTQPSKEYLYNTKTGQTVDPLANMQSQQKSISRAEYDALPKGSQYIGEDGKSYIKG